MSPTAAALLESTDRALTHRVAEVQSRARVPSLVAGVVRDGDLVWSAARGRAVTAADLDGPGSLPGVDTQYKIGSVTKTMTAALVMLARERGELALDDEVGRFLPEGPFASARLLDLLCHRAGLGAEPAGSWWERSPGGDLAALRLAHADVVPVLGAGGGLHYSNLGYGVLGGVLETVLGRPWWACVQEHLLAPLGLTRTSYHHEAPHADGLAVRDLTGEVTVEPLPDTGAMAPAGQLWSTVADLAVWLTALVDADRSPLAAESLRLMATPQVGTPEDRSGSSWGLGVSLQRAGGRVLLGHGGSMPGFSCGVLVDRDTRVGTVVLTNAAWGMGGLGADLLGLVLDREPTDPPEWRPVREVPDDVRSVVGLWHWGEAPSRLWWDGALLRLDPLHGVGRVAAFRPGAEPGTWVGVRGYFDGELLRAVAAGDVGEAGPVSHLECATFVLTRTPYDPAAPIPGGAPG